MTGERFGHWLKTNLLVRIPKGSTIIMDNAGFHRKKRLESICKDAGVRQVFLPTYSPDLNPIEKGRANMKRALRDCTHSGLLLETAIYTYWS